MTAITKIPKLEEIIADTPEKRAQDELSVILNQNPPKQWLKENPQVKGVFYIPVERIEYLLTRIFGKWWVEIRNTQVIANSVVVTVRLFVVFPRLHEDDKRTEQERIMWQDGIGGVPIQTDKGASATDFTKVKNNAVMLAAPAAESFALKDAAEKFGKLFGKDLNRKDEIAYESMLKPKTTEQELKALYEEKKRLFTPEECKNFERILNEQEVLSYDKMKTALNSRV